MVLGKVGSEIIAFWLAPAAFGLRAQEETFRRPTAILLEHSALGGFGQLCFGFRQNKLRLHGKR